MTSKLKFAAIVLALGGALVTYAQSQVNQCPDNQVPNPDLTNCRLTPTIDTCCYTEAGGGAKTYYFRPLP